VKTISLVAILTILLLGCRNNQLEHVEQRKQELDEREQELNEREEALNERQEAKNNTDNSSQSSENDNSNTITLPKYLVIVAYTTDPVFIHIDPLYSSDHNFPAYNNVGINDGVHVSNVIEDFFYTEDEKFKRKDNYISMVKADVNSDFSNAFDRALGKTDPLGDECQVNYVRVFVFGTYQEASIQRQQILDSTAKEASLRIQRIHDSINSLSQ
jgi:hypothetical protein